MRLNQSRVALAKNQVAVMLARTQIPKMEVRQSQFGCQSKKFWEKYIAINAANRTKHAASQPIINMSVRFMFLMSQPPDT